MANYIVNKRLAEMLTPFIIQKNAAAASISGATEAAGMGSGQRAYPGPRSGRPGRSFVIAPPETTARPLTNT